MFKRAIISGLLSILLGVPCIAQMTPEDAAAALRQREAERAAAATQPDELASQIVTLKAALADQAKLIEQLRAQVDLLQKQLAARPLPVLQTQKNGQAFKPQWTFESRERRWLNRAAAEDHSSDDRLMDLAIATDKAIAAYLASHPTSDDIAAAMYRGNPAIGMTEEALKIVTTVDVRSEDAGARIYGVGLKPGGSDSPHYSWSVVVSGGKVIEIDVQN
jgi:uncharacterized coiled-coil protein SlyX